MTDNEKIVLIVDSNVADPIRPTGILSRLSSTQLGHILSRLEDEKRDILVLKEKLSQLEKLELQDIQPPKYTPTVHAPLPKKKNHWKKKRRK